MRTVPWGAWLVLVAALSGCTDAGPEAPVLPPADSALSPEVTQPPLNDTVFLEGPKALDAAYGAKQCQGGLVYLNADKNLLSASLPAGFRARDAADLVLTASATDRGLAALAAYECRETALGPGPYAFGSFAIYVEPPRLEASPAAVDQDWYEIGRYTSYEPLHELLGPTEYALYHGAARHTLVSVPNGPSTGDGEVRDEEGVAFDFKAVAALAQRQATFSERIWHDTAQGLVFTEMSVRSDVVQGTALCNIRSGSRVQEVTKTTSCSAENVWVGVVLNDTEWEGVIRSLPGVHATP